MYWPNPSDFSRILQTPQVAFRAPELQACQIEKNTLGQPRPRAGNFATVYRGILPDGDSTAIRVFNLGRDERRERYEAISQYLRDRTLPCLVAFEYVESGIRSPSDGKFYPLVTMEWVQGSTIFTWLARQCQRRDVTAILSAADQWVDVVDQLRRAHVAHGDLQHGNIMVDEAGRLRLVDYDCMCVPELVGRRNLEIGVDPYQHPQRNSETRLSLDLDNFSSLMILTSLRALAAAPDLWHKYVDEPGYDKLLFRASDFLDPHNSELHADLMNSPDELVGELTAALLEAYHGAIERVPSLDEILDPFETVEQFLAARDWDAALQLIQRKGIEHEVPPRLQGAVREAVDRVDCRKALEEAVEQGNEIDMQRLYLPGLLDDYPAAQEAVRIARQAGEVIPVLKRLRSVHKQKQWEEFVRTWDDYRSLLIGRKSAARFQREAEQWRRRNTTFARLQALLADADADEIEQVDVSAIAAAWRQLTRLGGHPQADPLEPQVRRLIKREKWRRAVEHISDQPTEEDDRNLVALWDEQLLADWPEVEPWQERFQEGRLRLSRLTQLRCAMDTCPPQPTCQSEQAIVEAVRDLPEAYQHNFTERVAVARQRLDAAARLQAALDQQGPEADIVSLWQQLLDARGQALLDADCADRVDLAHRRIPLLRKLASIETDLPAAKLDKQLLKVWDDELLQGCGDARQWQPLYEAARDRRELLRQIEDALAAQDDRRIGQLVADPLLLDYPLRSTWAGPVRLAQERTQAVAQLMAAMDEGRTEGFVKLFDVELLAQFSDDLADYEPQIEDWVVTEIRPCERVGLRPAFRSPLVKIDRANFRLRWSWPPSRFSDRCIVTLSAQEPGSGQRPLELAVDARIELTRQEWNEAGGSLVMPVEAAWGSDYVAVWAVIELGFATVYSEPLLLGQLPHTRVSKRKHP